MVHDKLSAGIEVSPVKLVRNIPAERAKLAPLLHHCVEKGNGVEHGRPGRVVGVVQGVLRDVAVGPLEAGPDALGRFVGEFERHLQQPDGKVLVDLGGQPEPKVGVHLVGVEDRLHDLVAKVKREMAVLQHQPVPVDDGVGDHLAGTLLLSLTHGKRPEVLHAQPGQRLDLARGVGASGEEADERDPVVRLIQHRLQVQHRVFQEVSAKRVENVFPCLKF